MITENEKAINHINTIVEQLRGNDARDVSAEEVQLFLAKQVMGLKAIVEKLQDEATYRR